MFKTLKFKVLLFLVLGAALATGANAAVLTADQLTAVTNSITGGIGEYVAFALAVIVITYPAMLIIRGLSKVGRGRSI